jgi:hypothetical protein
VPILVPIGAKMGVGGLEPAKVDESNVNSKMIKKKKKKTKMKSMRLILRWKPKKKKKKLI